jgi:hypothetical protein
MSTNSKIRKSKPYLDDLKRASEDRPKIIECLRANVSEECKEVFRKNVIKDPLWAAMHHLDYGMYIRNLLRENGYDYNSWVMDRLWIEWTEEAIL